MPKDTNPLLEAIAKIEHFSPGPRILGKAMSLLGDPNSSLEDISALIETDTALTAQIVRAANSAFYGGGERVGSLSLAVQKIGFRESVRLVNLLVTQVLAAKGLNCYGISADAYWNECLFNGLFMEELARKISVGEADEAHTAGLLRYIGRLAIDQSIKDLGYGLFWDGASPLSKWESQNVGFQHTTAAGLLLRGWNFSEQLVNAIEWQDAPQCAPTPSWLANALHFTATILSPGTAPAAEIAVTEIRKTDFALEHQLTPVIVQELIDASSRRFKSIRGELFGATR